MNLLIKKLFLVSKCTVNQPHFLHKPNVLFKDLKYPYNICLFTYDSDSTPKTIAHGATTKHRADPVITALRSASSVYDVLKVIGVHVSHMETNHLTFSLKTLNKLKKQYREEDVDIFKNEEFLLLFRRLKNQLYSLEIKDIIEALKAVTFFKVPFDSSITMKLLHLIKKEINSLSLNQAIFLSFLLRQHPKSSVVEALKIGLPIVFENQVKTKLDRSNVAALVDALIYSTKNGLSQETYNFIVKALYELDQLDWMTMDPKKAKSIIIALTEIPVTSPIYEAVYMDAVEIFTKNVKQFSFSEVDLTITSIVYAMKRLSYLNQPVLFESTYNVDFEKWSMDECSIFLRKLNLAGFVNKKLLDSLAEKILDEPERFREGKFSLIKTFVAGLSIANYKTDHWKLLKDLIPAASVLQNIKPKEPWVSFCLELASIDVFYDPLISQVFNPWFLEDYLAREYNKLDLLQVLRLYQSVTVLNKGYSGDIPPSNTIKEAQELNGTTLKISPLIGALDMELGKSSVISRCKTSLGHYIDHFVALKPGGEAVQFPNSEKCMNIDELNLPEGCQRVAILFLSPTCYNSLKQLRGTTVLTIRTLEELGYAVVAISSDSWLNLPDWEKCPYLYQQIKLSCSDLYHREKDVIK